ncbi:MAG: PP2C family protein-serine/threonine phosphatase [Anaerolineae bacterium]
MPPYKTIQRRMGLAAIALNLLGALALHFYLSVIDPLPTGQQPLRKIEGIATVGFVLLMASTLATGAILTRRRDRRIGMWYERLRGGAAADELPVEVRRDVLNQGLLAATVTVALWGVATMTAGWLTGSYRPIVGMAIGGLLSSILVYLVADLLARPMVPLFFPRGDLEAARAFRLPVLGRLLVVFLLIGVLPPALLVSLTWQRAQALTTVPNPQAVLANLYALQAFVLGSGVVASIGLAVLVTRAITAPLDRLQRAMASVEQGELDARVAVTTNDELGYLAQRFNEMAAGLQERERIRAAHQQVAQELAVAWKIQESFLPRVLPEIPGWQLAATLEPCRETSGDFYDLISLPDGKVGLLVADVADKGTGAALYMALSRTLIRTYAVEHVDHPERALAAANRRILGDAQADLFVTVFYGVLDPASGQLAYCNAGHNPPYVLRGQSRETVALRRTGMPLGVFDDAAWEERQIQLGPGEAMVLYSDGITEAQNAAGELFGEARLLQAVQLGSGYTARELEEALLGAVRAFRGSEPQSDDITLLVVARARASTG